MLSKVDLEKIQEMIDLLENRLDTKLDNRFNELDNRFTKLDNRFNELDNRFTKLDNRFNELDNRFKKLETEVELNTVRSKIFIETLKYKPVSLQESVGQTISPTGLNSRKRVTFEGPLF